MFTTKSYKGYQSKGVVWVLYQKDFYKIYGLKANLGSGRGGNSIFQSLSTPGEFVYWCRINTFLPPNVFITQVFLLLRWQIFWTEPAPRKSALPHGRCHHQSRPAKVLTLENYNFRGVLVQLVWWLGWRNSGKAVSPPTRLMRRWKWEEGCL